MARRCRRFLPSPLWGGVGGGGRAMGHRSATALDPPTLPHKGGGSPGCAAQRKLAPMRAAPAGRGEQTLCRPKESTSCRSVAAAEAAIRVPVLAHRGLSLFGLRKRRVILRHPQIVVANVWRGANAGKAATLIRPAMIALCFIRRVHSRCFPHRRQLMRVELFDNSEANRLICA